MAGRKDLGQNERLGARRKIIGLWHGQNVLRIALCRVQVVREEGSLAVWVMCLAQFLCWLLKELGCPSKVVWMRSVPRSLLYLNTWFLAGGRQWSLWGESMSHEQLPELTDVLQLQFTLPHFACGWGCDRKVSCSGHLLPCLPCHYGLFLWDHKPKSTLSSIRRYWSWCLTIATEASNNYTTRS